MLNENDFLPTTLQECVISDVLSKDKLEKIITKVIPFPAFGKCGILLHGPYGTVLISQIQNATQYVSFNTSGLHYSILDEVDNLTDAAQASLKAIMTGLHGIFILTTNHIGSIDKGVVNRCHVIHMMEAQPKDWLPLVKKVITKMGGSLPPDSSLIPVIAQCDGSAREIMTSAIEVGSMTGGKI